MKLRSILPLEPNFFFFHEKCFRPFCIFKYAFRKIIKKPIYFRKTFFALGGGGVQNVTDWSFTPTLSYIFIIKMSFKFCKCYFCNIKAKWKDIMSKIRYYIFKVFSSGRTKQNSWSLHRACFIFSCCFVACVVHWIKENYVTCCWWGMRSLFMTCRVGEECGGGPGEKVEEEGQRGQESHRQPQPTQGWCMGRYFELSCQYRLWRKVTQIIILHYIIYFRNKILPLIGINGIVHKYLSSQNLVLKYSNVWLRLRFKKKKNPWTEIL